MPVRDGYLHQMIELREQQKSPLLCNRSLEASSKLWEQYSQHVHCLATDCKVFGTDGLESSSTHCPSAQYQLTSLQSNIEACYIDNSA
jgi:hypothetical protein